MSVSADLRALLRERLTAVLDQVLSQVLLELDRTLTDYEADKCDEEESLKRALDHVERRSASPQLRVRRCFLSGSSQKQSTACSSEVPAAANVEDCNEIQITSVTSTFSSLSGTDPNAWKIFSCDLKVEEEQSSEKLQSLVCASRSDVLQVKQELKDGAYPPSGHVQLDELRINCVTSLSTSSMSSSPGPTPNMDTEGKSLDEERSDSEQRQDSSESNSREETVSSQRNCALSLKLPVIKLHPLIPKTGPQNKNVASKNVPTKPKHKKGGNTARKGIKYMCYCGKLFTKEDLELHKTLQDGEERPFGCPSSVRASPQFPHSKRGRYEAFHVKGRTEERGSSFNRGAQMEDFPNKMGDEMQRCEENNLRYFKENILQKSNTVHPKEKNKVCENDQAGSLKEQRTASVDAGGSGDMSKPFSCDVCGRGFSWLPRLYKHRRNHFVTGPFWCSHCGRTFRFVKDLRSHECVQTGNKPYKCKVCDEAFFLKIQLENHTMQHKSAQKRVSGRTDTA